MRYHCAHFLALLPSTLALATSHPYQPRNKAPNLVSLRPIQLNNGTQHDLNRRASEHFSNLDIRTQEELIYGSPGVGGQAVLANMTLYAPDGLQMIMMERFQGYTTAVDCNDDDDGIMSLTFASQSAYDYALRTWSSINEKEQDKFLLIANHPGCSPVDQRQPYFITEVKEDNARLTTSSSAKPANWSEVAGNYAMDFGRLTQQSKSPSIAQRNIWDTIKGIGSDIGNSIMGNVDLDEGINILLNIGTPGKVTNIYTDLSKQFTLDCVNCFIQGSFELSGHLKVHHFKLQNLSLLAQPEDFEAELEVHAVLKEDANPVAIEYSIPLWSAPIPDAGITVPDLFELGAFLEYEVGVAAQFRGAAEAAFGLKAELPNSAQVTADISNPGNSSAGGFQGAITPVFEIDEFAAAVTVSAFTQPTLKFGIDVTGIGHADVALLLKLPQISATFKGEYNTEGVCGQPAGGATTAVEISAEAAIEVDVAIELGLGGTCEGDETESGSPSLAKKLFGVSVPLAEKCIPVNGGPKPEPTGATSLLASTSIAADSISPSLGKFGVSGTLPRIAPSVSAILDPSVSVKYPSGTDMILSSAATSNLSTTGYVRPTGTGGVVYHSPTLSSFVTSLTAIA